MSTKPLVVHIVGNLAAGGIPNLILQLTVHPVMENYRHAVIAVKGAERELADEFASQEIPVYVCPIVPRVDLKVSYRLSHWLSRALQFTFPWRLSRLLRKVDADIVHTHSFSTQNIPGQAVGITSQARLPWVWSVHGYFEIPDAEVKQWQKGYALARRGRLHVTADSQFLSDLVKKNVLRDAEIQVVYPGIELGPYSHNVGTDSSWRVQNHIPAFAILFGSTGRLTHVKGFDLLLNAASLLIGQGMNIWITIAGKGELHAALQKQIDDFGLTERVHLLGFQPDLPNYLRQLDVFILPSRSEGFPLSLLEALASGLPCVAARVGGVPEMLEHGIVVPPEDSQALAQAMTSLLDLLARQSLASQSRQIVARYSMDRCAQEFKKVYDNLLR